MSIIKVYIYPTYRGNGGGSGNTYIKLFHDAFLNHKGFRVCNRRPFGDHTYFNMFANIDSQIFFFNWIESQLTTHKGVFRFSIFFVFLIIIKVLGKDVVWILHNKHPHEGETMMTRVSMKLLAKVSTFVITHSTEGIRYYRLLDSRGTKCYYIPHPVYTVKTYLSKDFLYDYIIWGEIMERKKVLEFLRYAKNDSFLSQKRILICGRCKDDEYAKKISKETNERISFINRFVEETDLIDKICHSKVILFTYDSSSVLASGALIYSLNFLKPIIGPKVGSFADLEGIVNCYDTFEDISKLTINFSIEAAKKYIEDNQWVKFPQKVFTILYQKQA